MSRGNSKNVVDGSKSGRAEIMAAVAGLAKEVEHLATNVRRVVVVADTHRPARLPPRAKRGPEVPRKIASSATACGRQPADISQAENVRSVAATNPQWNSRRNLREDRSRSGRT